MQQRGIVFHESDYRISLLRYFHQYNLSHEYGGCADIPYEIESLKYTNELSEFILSYLDLSNN